MGSFYKTIIADTFPNLMVDPKIQNHLGGRIEYLLWSNIGLGVEYTYAAFSFKFQGSKTNYSLAVFKKQRVLAKFNFHFATSEKLDPYLTAGIGYSSTKLFSDEPDYIPETVNVLPVALRVGIGLRYFFSDFIGMHIEAGLGGPLMQAGVSFKI